ncbi:substrate-binding domain-containing protein [Chloroflexi bacterium TSY]|nr:substrate-binding domain-containing protein [Chloroflexi bacterium TSY]
MSLNTRKLTRRNFLKATAASTGLIALAACAPQAGAPTAGDSGAASPAEETPQLLFTGWNSLEFYDPVVQEFMQENPDVEVEYRQLSDYKQQTTLLVAGEQTDVIVTRDDDKAGFAAAGFIRSIDEEIGVPELVEDMFDGNRKAMTYEGELYGLPYYTDFHTIMYNTRLLEELGFSEPPESLGDLKDICLAMKDEGISDYPLRMWLYQESNFKEPMYSLVYASGGEWVDENWDPICQKPDSVVEQILAWMQDAVQTWEIMDPANLEMTDADVIEMFQTGHTAFQETNRYDLRKLNDPEQTAEAVEGERVFKPMIMPGLEGPGQGTIAWTRQYTINANAVDQAAAYRLQYFAGGKNAAGEYWTAKQWHDRFGLGFAYKSLGEDPDIVAGENAWGDPELFAQQKETAVPRLGVDAPWYSEWDNAMQAEWHKAVLGQVSPAEATEAMANKWNELRDSFES